MKKEEQIRVRTAKTDFTDSCGEAIKQGETFIIVEPRPQFYSRTWLSGALAALDAEPANEGEGA